MTPPVDALVSSLVEALARLDQIAAVAPTAETPAWTQAAALTVIARALALRALERHAPADLPEPNPAAHWPFG